MIRNKNCFFTESPMLMHEIAKMLSGKRIFITGGTGFFGKWLQLCFDFLIRQTGIKSELVVLSRDPDRFLKNNPAFKSLAGISYTKGNIRDFSFPAGKFDYVIHAATEASAKLAAEKPQEMYSVIYDGTLRVLNFIQQSEAKKLLYVSSGAVYGKQPHEISHMHEDFIETKNFCLPKDPYGKGKFDAEKLCLAEKYIETVIARPYAFAGPFLPLDTHFAVGNFILNCLNKQPIEIKGDGTPLRSYMYASELAEWLWAILTKGKSGRAYNVGSEQAVSIYELARNVATCFKHKTEIIVRQKPEPDNTREQYIPDTSRARKELKLKLHINLQQTLQKTVDWHLNQKP